ncbi:MAG: hypothetical protein F2542_00815 [Actinobacteria bacterium]|uniref:Unannotated protein n=1 Tax=freshwater metagenome TaxID=449393 RepID=A0A6J6CC88_9ZZZZ|nr:hypothetical protein [Actinomycetota bacterium]
MHRVNALKSIALALVAGVGITGCTISEGVPPEPVASVEPEYFFFPTGSATQNLPIFENVLAVTGAGKPGHKLSDSIALLVETGFEIEDITHTPVDSKIGEPADSVSLAVAFNGECLIAQFSSSWIKAVVTEPTVSGCLIGDVEQATLESE